MLSKLSLAVFVAAAVVTTHAVEADMMRPRSDDAMRRDIDLKVGTKSFLRRPTALLNKNTLATDNNVYISRSNVVFSQGDRLAMARKIEAFVEDNKQEDAAVVAKKTLQFMSAPDKDTSLMDKASAVVVASKTGDEPTMRAKVMDLMDAVRGMRTEAMMRSKMAMTPNGPMSITYNMKPMEASQRMMMNPDGTMSLMRQIEAFVEDHRDEDAAVAAKNMLRAVSAADTDAVLMDKASGVVVASRGTDEPAFRTSVADFVKTLFDREPRRREQFQLKAPRGKTAFIGNTDILRQPSGVINADRVFDGNQITIARSQLAPTSDTHIKLDQNAKVGDALVGGSSIMLKPKDK